MYKRVGSHCGVPTTSGVEQQCYSANCGVVIRVVKSQRSGVNSGV
jgi:hypothetical protein